jgi:hypothetical protein
VPNANHKIREGCLICEGSGRSGAEPCAYCGGSGIVFASMGAPAEILVATGDCRMPVKLKPAQGLKILKGFT